MLGRYFQRSSVLTPLLFLSHLHLLLTDLYRSPLLPMAVPFTVNLDNRANAVSIELLLNQCATALRLGSASFTKQLKTQRLRVLHSFTEQAQECNTST